MDFDFSDDQEMLRDEVRKFLEARCPPATVRGVLEDPSRAHDAGFWNMLVEQGWTALTVPEDYGGLGMTRTDLCVLAEEQGRVLAPTPFASTVYILAEALMLAGSDEQKTLLAEIANGKCVGCLALFETAGEASYSQVETTVTDGLLKGVKLPVIDGMAATHALVWARDGKDAPRLYLADLNNKTVSRAKLETVDPSRDAARLIFDGTPAAPIGEPNLLDRLLDGAAVLLAFEQIGGADKCLEQAVEYAQERYAFGRAVGSYQAIKHKLADAYVNNQIARSNAYYGIWALDSGGDELPHAASAARVAACTAYWYAAKESIQTHGGIGFTWEADQHMYYRRALFLDMAIGSPARWRERLFNAVEDHAKG